LKTHCSDKGRDIKSIKISQQTICVIAKDKKELEEKIPIAKKRYGFFGDIEKFGIVGTPDQCVKKIEDNANKGITKYTIFFSDYMNPDTLRLFAKEVLPVFA